uniref:Integrin beta n=2 Tax=Culicoides sonorensis TaxID=179676 RepID=A0A336M8L1_CULSO
MKRTLSIAILLLLLNLVASQIFDPNVLQNPCISQNTCRDCIQTKGCAWCLQPPSDQFSNDQPRCFQPSLSDYDRCPEEFTWNPDNEQRIVIERALSRSSAAGISGGGYEEGAYVEEGYSGSSSYQGHYHEEHGASGSYGASGHRHIVQISPQRMNLKLRINEAHRISFRYARAEDYPVDLYYLMDLSKSMEDDKEKLSKLGDLLAETMTNITRNFRLGFGSFVDKVLMPYVSTVPKKLNSPCDGCAAPYGYRNHMKLDTDTTKFAQEVHHAKVSGNLDAPEGGFDAIMQAVVCPEQIGWRKLARRLLVFSTDAGFHYAGDGKLGGVIKPNDGECHMQNNMYTHSTIQDYPSISQINLKVKQNAINLIFAVTAQQESVYKKLSQHIEGSSCSKLEEDSSNVVDLVREEYSKISSAVEMKDNATSYIKVKYYSRCLGGNTFTETNKCDGLKVGDLIEFQAEIIAVSCPKDPAEWHQTLKIYPVGIDEALVIDLELLCSCPCEMPNSPYYEDYSSKCSGHGVYKCGICECAPDFYGRKCECSMQDLHSDITSGISCRPDNTSLVDCSGRGNCVCGVCECHTRPNLEEKITGKYCECDNFSCERHNGLLCSGPEQGTCKCGQCACAPGWGGPACSCKTTTDTCLAPGDTVLCSGHGECVCGECKCETTEEGRYSGRFCDKCPTCPGRCQEFKDCVQCQMYKTGPLSEEPGLCARNCSKIFTPISVEKVEVNEDKDDHLCTFYDENECRFQFVYNDREEERVVVRAQETPDCPPKVFMLGIILGVIAFIVLIGLAILLLWKLLTTIHDRREFARFEKERMMARWDTGENPIYKQATSTFKNPTYVGK